MRMAKVRKGITLPLTANRVCPQSCRRHALLHDSSSVMPGTYVAAG